MTTFTIMRRPCLPEDEGRHFYEHQCSTLQEAQAWISARAGEYFGPSDYYIQETPSANPSAAAIIQQLIDVLEDVTFAPVGHPAERYVSYMDHVDLGPKVNPALQAARNFLFTNQEQSK